MASNIVFKTDEGDYETRAYEFALADDLYMFFKFESPKSDCKIGLAYDVLVDGGDWYVNDGVLAGADYEIVDDIVWNRIMRTPEFDTFAFQIDLAIRRFNGC